MITDKQFLADVVQQWTTVKTLCKRSHRQAIVAGDGGPVFLNETPPDELYNLPFVLAYAVLDQILGELVRQGGFKCVNKKGNAIPNPTLGPKMETLKNILPWCDYATVDKGKCERNKLAHEATLLKKADCFTYIEAIENELKTWGIIS